MPAVQPLQPSDPPVIDAYTLTGRLGQGGQGIVYLAQTSTGERVAIKLFQAVLETDVALRKGIMRELTAAKQAARFCTAQVLDSGLLGDRPYIVSEYVPGPSLQKVVAAEGPVTGSALDRLAVGTATALVSLHDAGIIHCDFKPANVLLGPDGWRVIDFGISRMNTGVQTLASKVTGTPAFMAPEQLAGEPLEPAVDLFAWASTMAFAATGTPPFGNDTIPAVMNRITHYSPDLEGIEEPLAGLLGECLAKDPAQRPTARQVLDRLMRRDGFTGLAGSHDGDLEAGPRPETTTGPEHVVERPEPQRESDPDGPASGEHGRREHGAATPPEGEHGPLATDPSVQPVLATGAAGRAEAQEETRSHTGRLLAGALIGVAVSAVIAMTVVATVWMLPSAGSAHEPTSGTTSAAGGQVAAGPTTGGTPWPRRPAGRGGTPAQGAGHGAEPEGNPGAGAPGGGPPAGGPSPARSGAVRPPAGQPRPGTTTPPAASPPPAAKTRVELGLARFNGYCKFLGLGRYEYRDVPLPGAYCVNAAGEATALSAQQRDEGCQWRFSDPTARHYYRGRANRCYTYQ